jgi:antagonist of KipI
MNDPLFYCAFRILASLSRGFIVIEVIKPGLLTSIQDRGRWGYQSYGVGIAGALDSFALTAANLLVGNPEEVAGVEITLLGPTLRFHRETIFALAGADLEPSLDGKAIPNWTCHLASFGSVLSFKARKSGIRTYLAVSGGIEVPPVMGSRSTYLLGRFGGLGGRALKARDSLPIPPPSENFRNYIGRTFPEYLRPPYQKNPSLRVVLGPFEEFFSEEGIQAFLSAAYTITSQSNRMGYRLQGVPIQRQKAGELITCGLANGTIQVPPDGQPILLLAERQTIGGYPIIATMIHADLSLIAQCAPGDQLSFSGVSLEEARTAYIQLWGNMEKFKQTANRA